MNKKTVLPLLIALILCIFSVNGVMADETYKGESTVLTALKIDETINVDGRASEPSWTKARILHVPIVDGKVGDVDVEMRALYDTEFVYFFISWPDPTKSDATFWKFDGEAWIPPSKTTEDMFSIFWDINSSIRGYDIAGCAVTCHADRMRTYWPEERADYWKWHGEKDNPLGYIWDGFLDNTLVLGEEIKPDFSNFTIKKTWHAHKMDGTPGGYDPWEINEISGAPLYFEPGASGEDARHILKEEVLYGDAVLLKSNTSPASVPAYILERPEGSPGDIVAKGVYLDEKWNLEIVRKLWTGNDDDVQFDTADVYRFSIAVNDDSHGAADVGHGEGHSISMLAKTLEFGGIGSEEVTQLALIQDYLVTARAFIEDGKTELAYSEINNALGQYNEIRGAVASKDPGLYLNIKERFEDAKRDTSINNIDILIGGIDDAILTMQGKRAPKEPSWNIKLIVAWGKVQIYVFILLAIVALFPVLKSVQVGRKPELRNISIFLLIVTIPVLLEGIGRVGILTKIYFLQNFSFMTNEYATLLWAALMTTAMFLARAGFGEVDSTIKSLESYGIGLEQKVVERTKELKRSEEKYRSLIETMNDGVGIIGKDHTMTFANKMLGEILEYPPEEIIGKDALSFLDEKNKDKLMEELQKRASGAASIYELEWTTKTGKKVPTLVSAAPLFDEKSNFRGSFAVITDITERKRFEQQLRQSEKLAATGQLAASIAHEINNPLSGIKNCIYILMDEIGKDDSKNYLEMADKELDRIARIVKQLLDFYRPAKETMVTTEINDVIEDVLKFMEPQLKKQNIKVSKKLDQKMPKIMASGEQLKQVFMNLILNAQEAMPMRGKLDIKTKFEDKNIKIEFNDNGIGISEDEIENLFDPFYSTKKEGKGTGLGLSVSYGIIRAHNGRVEVSSKVGKGTTFTITLPIE